MKTKKTIITLVVLVLAWFILSHLTNKTENVPETTNTNQEQNISETEETPENIAAELEIIVAEEQDLDQEIDGLQAYTF